MRNECNSLGGRTGGIWYMGFKTKNASVLFVLFLHLLFIHLIISVLNFDEGDGDSRESGLVRMREDQSPFSIGGSKETTVHRP